MCSGSHATTAAAVLKAVVTVTDEAGDVEAWVVAAAGARGEEAREQEETVEVAAESLDLRATASSDLRENSTDTLDQTKGTWCRDHKSAH